MSKIIIINGPNLNLLGEREQTQYGSKDYKHLKEICVNRAKDLNIEIEIKQSNIEDIGISFESRLKNRNIFKNGEKYEKIINRFYCPYYGLCSECCR